MKSGCPDSEKMEATKSVLEKEVSEVLTEKQQKISTAYIKKNSPQQKRGRPE